MQLVKAYDLIKKMKRQVVQTRDVAAILKMKTVSASQVLVRLQKKGLVVSLKKGLWAITEGLNPFYLAEELIAPFPSYLSCQTALYQHNMIDQIPSVIYSVTPGRTKIFELAIGTFSFHHIEPSFFFGFDVVGKQQIKIASPEKALLDFFYLRTGVSNLFRALPEIEFSDDFSWGKTLGMAEKIKNRRIKTIVLEQVDILRRKSRC